MDDATKISWDEIKKFEEAYEEGRKEGLRLIRENRIGLMKFSCAVYHDMEAWSKIVEEWKLSREQAHCIDDDFKRGMITVRGHSPFFKIVPECCEIPYYSGSPTNEVSIEESN